MMTFVIVTTQAGLNAWITGDEILLWFASRRLIINHNDIIYRIIIISFLSVCFRSAASSL